MDQQEFRLNATGHKRKYAHAAANCTRLHSSTIHICLTQQEAEDDIERIIGGFEYDESIFE